jgi:hypothetical protein
VTGVLPFHRDSGFGFDRMKAKARRWRAYALHGCLLYQLAAENTSYRFVCFQKELFTSSAARLQPKNVSTGSQDLNQG